MEGEMKRTQGLLELAALLFCPRSEVLFLDSPSSVEHTPSSGRSLLRPCISKCVAGGSHTQMTARPDFPSCPFCRMFPLELKCELIGSGFQLTFQIRNARPAYAGIYSKLAVGGGGGRGGAGKP